MQYSQQEQESTETMRQRNRVSENNHEFFKEIPSEIVIDILSRLPILAVLTSKCVCKSWLNLVETDEFVKSHLAKGVPGLAVNDAVSCKIYEFEDVLDQEEHELHYVAVNEFDCNDYGMLEGSANGLLFMCNQSLDSQDPDELHIFNPITCEYLEISCCQEFSYRDDQVVTYGFGVSRVAGQFKVVRVFHDCIHDEETEELVIIPKSECQVYTLGTGSWRSITPGPMLEYEYDVSSSGALLYGNLHWLVVDLNGCPWISCFDLEDEVFSIFPSPPGLPCHIRMLVGLYALEDCLCLSDNMCDDIVIWFMKDYGGEKSWSKEFVISKSQIPHFVGAKMHIAHPMKVFKDGDILMAWGELSLFYYSSKTKTTHEIYIFDFEATSQMTIDPILHTSSFLSLKTFANEKVASF